MGKTTFRDRNSAPIGEISLIKRILTSEASSAKLPADRDWYAPIAPVTASAPSRREPP